MDISKLLSDPVPESRRRASDPSARTVSGSRSRSSTKGKKSDDTKRATCETCGSSFVSKAHLAIHDRTVHKGLKLYECDICHVSFGQPGTLTRHKTAVHEKRRDHECSYASCRKRFGSKWTLSVHERNVHQKIKPYTCSFPGCVKAFGNLWNQKKHETNVHNIEHVASEKSSHRMKSGPSKTEGRSSGDEASHTHSASREGLSSREKPSGSASKSQGLTYTVDQTVVGHTRHRSPAGSQGSRDYSSRAQRAKK